MEYSLTRDRIAGMFAGIAIGDARGLPFETMSHSAIVRATGGSVDEYYDPSAMRTDGVTGLKVGSTSDDWQLTSAVANSILAKHGFDIYSQAIHHMMELSKSTFGWGKGSIAGIQGLLDRKRDIGTPPPHVLHAGAGNGVMMKGMPVALHVLLTGTFDQCPRDIFALGTLTHSNPSASVAAIAIAHMLADALSAAEIGALQAKHARVHFNKRIRKYEEDIDLYTSAYKTCDSRVSDILLPPEAETFEELLAENNTGFTCWDTLRTVTQIVHLYGHDFAQAINHAIMLGGDTDTNASIVGGLVGARLGLCAIPEDLRTIDAVREAIILADLFYTQFSGGRE